MSSASLPSTPTPPAPWSSLFQSHISQLSPPSFNLSTLHRTPDSTTPYTPRGRTLIYRGMFASLPPNPLNDAPKNPAAYASDLPTFTTDVRSAKLADLFLGGEAAQTQGCGGGGPVEAVFWIQPTMTQWRIRGDAWVLGPDISGPGESDAKTALGPRMRVLGEDVKDWSWEREVGAHFGNLSPGMRGSFQNPLPGTPIDEKGEMDETDKDMVRAKVLGRKVGTGDEGAKANFRVVVIRPLEVERVDLTDMDRARRWIYTFVEKGGKGEWKTVEVWP